MKTIYFAFISIMSFSFLPGPIFGESNSKAPATSSQNRVILFIWDGLRPDSVTAENTPNLHQLMKSGVQFLDNHSSYPTFTMINAGSFATGNRAGLTGFYGNKVWDTEVRG